MTPPVTQAIVLAAGRGSRLGAAGAQAPKCLVPLAGRPLLAWTMDALRACGVNDIRIVAGWCAEALHAWSDTVLVNERWASTGVVRSLLLADAFLREAPAIVVYGDGAYGAASLRRVLDGSASDLLVPGDRRWRALWSRRFADPLLDAETWRSHEGQLLEIGARAASLDAIEAQFMGLLRVTPEGWATMRDHLARWQRDEGAVVIDRLDMTALLSRLLADGVRLPCIEVDGGWVEIDSLGDIEAVERALHERDFTHDFR